MNPQSREKIKNRDSAIRVLIAGASARAAAESAFRAGFQPVCLDLFADEDLKQRTQVVLVKNYPQGIHDLAKTLPSSPWMYVGALENSPELISEVSRNRPLWGNPADVVEAVRDLVRFHSVLTEADLCVPDVRCGADPPLRDGKWLLKPVRGAAGRGICVWDEDAAPVVADSAVSYFQERISGIPLSALYLGMRDGAELVGVSRQLVGETWLGAKPFQYCGSIGPVGVSESVRKQLVRLGDVLSEHFRLRGLFGVDFVCDGEDVFPVEVNPRYTASVEVFERAADIALLEWHSRACRSFEDVEASCEPVAENQRSEVFPVTGDCVVGKAILYAMETTCVPDMMEWRRSESKTSLPKVADIPAVGTLIEAGHPICTVFAIAGSEDACREELVQNGEKVRDALSRGFL